MNINLILILLFLICILLKDSDVSCKSRGGGGRGGGGGSRGGGSRSSGSGSRSSGGSRTGGSGFRSGNSFRSGTVIKSRSIYTSNRYNSWSVRVGVSSSVRYRVSPWGDQHRAMIAGYIIMSHNQRSRFHMSDRSYYDGISICYNEEPIYDRNVSASPWFVCPWDDYSERFCCGDEVEERCCRYFERPGHKAGLMIGIVLMILLIFLIAFFYKRAHTIEKSTVIVYSPEFKEGDKSESECIEGSPLITYPQMPMVGPEMPCTNLPYSPNPPFPTGPYPTDNNLPYPTSAPYPVGPPPSENPAMPYPASNLPYPVSPNDGTMPLGYPDGGVQYAAGNYPTAPNVTADVAPPSYEDALKIRS